MNRRDLMKGTAAVFAAQYAPHSPGMTAHPSDIPTPKTVEELRAAIERIFTVVGHSHRAFEIIGDGQTVRFVTYASNVKTRSPIHSSTLEDSFWPTAEQAIEQTWNNVVDIRHGRQTLTAEQKEDGFVPVPSTRIYWRAYPELCAAETGIVGVRMRAAFL